MAPIPSGLHWPSLPAPSIHMRPKEMALSCPSAANLHMLPYCLVVVLSCTHQRQGKAHCTWSVSLEPASPAAARANDARRASPRRSAAGRRSCSCGRSARRGCWRRRLTSSASDASSRRRARWGSGGAMLDATNLCHLAQPSAWVAAKGPSSPRNGEAGSRVLLQRRAPWAHSCLRVGNGLAGWGERRRVAGPDLWCMAGSASCPCSMWCALRWGGAARCGAQLRGAA
jgi:hypothetical protein